MLPEAAHKSQPMKQALRVFSLPMLWRGDRLRNSVSLWFMAMALGVVGGCTLGGWTKVLCIEGAVISFLVFAYWSSARLQRESGLRWLAAQACPVCGVQIGKEASLLAFAGYTRSCLEFLEQAKGAFSIEPGRPLGFCCPECSSELFYDYLGSDELFVREDGEVPAPASESDVSR